MKNKEGFTLIELLAVIVILAVIMVIAVPKILDVITKSRESAAESSIKLVKDAIKTQIATSGMSGVSFEKGEDNCYEFIFGEEANENAQKLSLKNKDKIGGSVKYCDGTFPNEKDKLIFDGESISNKPSERKVIKIIDTNSNGIADVGEMLAIESEKFHVISNDGTKVKALAEYNLYVGDIHDSNGNKIRTIESTEEGYGLQNSNAKGWLNGQQRVGMIAFSTSRYWSESGTINLNNETNLIYPHLVNYKSKLESMGATIRDITLITIDEMYAVGEMSWIFTTCFWSRSAHDSDNSYIWYVFSPGAFYSRSYNDSSESGIRPVIELLSADIEY